MSLQMTFNDLQDHMSYRGPFQHQYIGHHDLYYLHCVSKRTSPTFLPGCMECRRGLAMRILSVRLSVRPSVTRVNWDKTVKRLVQIHIPYERTFSLVF